MSNEIITKENIENMIYEVRGIQVMLDSDLAKLYQCKNGTKSINLAAKRNINRFPEDFYFQLTEDEYSRFQFETLNIKKGENRKYLPYVFTEQGVAMLSSVLHTDVAEEASVKIMRAFVNMRKYIFNNLTEQRYINNLVLKHDERLSIVEDTLNKLNEKQKVNTIFFEGQIFDAYVFFMDILKKAKEEIIIIDNYGGLELLKLIKEINKKIKIYSSNINEEHIKRYKKQYENVELVYNDKFHDRFIIIDKREVYHSGASFKDLGSKCFCISLIKDDDVLQQLLSKLNL